LPVNIPDKHKSLVFLREDVLVHGRSLDLSSISIIPPAGDSDIRLVEQLGLPKIKKAFSDELLYDNSFGNNPTSVTSFTERLFTTDSVRLWLSTRRSRTSTK